MTRTTATTLQHEIDRIMGDLDGTGFVYGLDIDSGASFGYRPDEPVVTASVFKIPVLVEFCRRVAAGELAATDRVAVAAEGRTMGGTGLSAMRDPIDISLRDLAMLMMSVSDNHATDVLVDLLGTDAINATAARLGFPNTVIRGTCARAFQDWREDLGVEELPSDLDDLAENQPELLERLRTSRAMVPATASRTTPREIATLLGAVWRDELLTPQACAEVRRLMSMQVFHGLAFGFPDDRVRIYAKTGSIPFAKCEAAVVEFPDGGRYALGVFFSLRAHATRFPAAYRAFSAIAAGVVDHLRA